MNSVEAELAELRLTLRQANENLDRLERKIADSRNLSGQETGIKDDKPDSIDLIERAEKFLEWGRLKSGTLDAGNGLFTDSCWNMCLDIFLCGLKDQQVTVSAIAHSSGIPMTTAMRYINVMVEQGLLQKSSNPADHRMVFVAVSENCRTKIERLLFSAPL